MAARHGGAEPAAAGRAKRLIGASQRLPAPYITAPAASDGSSAKYRVNRYIRHNLTAENLKTTMFAYPSAASDIGYML